MLPPPYHPPPIEGVPVVFPLIYNDPNTKKGVQFTLKNTPHFLRRYPIYSKKFLGNFDEMIIPYVSIKQLFTFP